MNIYSEGYNNFIKNEKIKITRIMSVVSFILYGAFSILDYSTGSQSITYILVVRFIVMFFLITTFISTFLNIFDKYYCKIIIATFLIAGGGIVILVYPCDTNDIAPKTYFAGLLLIIMTLFSMTYIRNKQSISVAIILIALFVSLDLYKLYTNENTINIAIPISHFFFLLGATIIGLLSQYMRDEYLWSNYMLQNQLKHTLREITHESEANKDLALHDELTGLHNRRFIMEELNKALNEAKQLNKILIIVYLDLNKFKHINDTYGHDAGDLVLQVTAKRLKAKLRKKDYIARLGGDEFLMGLLVTKKQLNLVGKIQEKICQALVEPIIYNNQSIKIGTSIGCSTYPYHGNSINVLIEIADKKMYAHKDLIRMNKKITQHSKKPTTSKNKALAY